MTGSSQKPGCSICMAISPARLSRSDRDTMTVTFAVRARLHWVKLRHSPRAPKSRFAKPWSSPNAGSGALPVREISCPWAFHKATFRDS